jgi:hypothetical protein
MRIRTFALALGVALLTLTASAQESGKVPPKSSDLGSAQIAEAKTGLIAERLVRINEIAEKLEKLGDPARKGADETNEEYLKRVDRIFKARGLFIVELHQEMQVVLEAKAQLDLYLERYERFVQRAEKYLERRPGELRMEVVILQKKGEDAIKDAVVLREMLLDEAKDDKPLTERLNKEPYDQLPKDVQGKASRQSQFLGLSVKEKEEKLGDLIGVVIDSAFEMNLLTKTLIPEAEDLRAILPPEHQKALANIRETFEKNKGQMSVLESKAAQLSILAKYHAANLQLVRPMLTDGKDPLERMLEIRKMTAESAPILERFLRATKAEALTGTGVGSLAGAIKTLQNKPDGPREK